MGRVFIFIKNFWCLLWHWAVLVIPVRLLFPNEPSWLGADWYALLAGYELGVPLTVFGFISFVMTSQYIEFNRFPLVSLFSGRGLVNRLNTGVEDFLESLAEEEGEESNTTDTKEETKEEPSGITDEVDEDVEEEDSQEGSPQGGYFKVVPPSL